MATITGGERWLRIDSTAETTPGVQNGAPTWDAVRVRGGGFGIKEGRSNYDTDEHANTTTQPAPALSHFSPAGSIDIIPSPFDTGMNFGGSPTRSAFKFFLDAALSRTSGVLDSYTMTEVMNDIVTRNFTGMKCNGFTMGFSEGDARLNFSTEWLGLSTGRETTALGSGDAPTFPSSRDWLVRQASVEIGDQQGQSTAFSSVNDSLLSLSLTAANGLTPGKIARWFPGTTPSQNETVRYGPRELIEQSLEVTGTFTLKGEDTTWYDKLISDALGEIRIFAYHPDSASFLIDTSDPTLSGTVDVTINVSTDPSSDIVANDVVYIEDHSAADPETWPREVLLCTASTTGTIAVEVDGSSNADSVGRGSTIDSTGSGYVYSKGAQFWIPEIRVQDLEFVGGARDTINQQVTFTAQIKSAHNAPIRYLLR